MEKYTIKNIVANAIDKGVTIKNVQEADEAKNRILNNSKDDVTKE